MAASFCWPAGPAARPAGGDLAERPVAPGLLVFGRRAACGAPHDPPGVVPAGPFAGGGLDPGGGFPRPQVVDDLGLVQADDAFRQRVVVRVPGRPDRRRDPRGGQLGAVPDGQVLAAGVAVVDQPRHLDALVGPAGDRHHQRVQHQAGVVPRGGAPPGDQPGERVDDERGIGGARPGGYEGEVDYPQPVRGGWREVPVHQVRRPVLRRVGYRGPRLLPPAAAHPAQPQLAHQPLHGAPGRRDSLAVELVPDLPGAVPLAAVLIDPQDLLLQRGVADRPGRRRPRPGRVVPRRRDRHARLAQRPAGRLDPELIPEGLDEGRHQGYRWPSSAAKKALAVRKIALTRRSSAFSRSSARIRAASADAVPGRRPRSICACFAQPRSVSALIPSSPPTFRQAAVTLASWSLTRSSTSRTARSRSSSGYFRAAPIVPLSRGLGASTKPGAIQVPLYFELDGTFPNHEANPLEPKNLLDCQAAVKETGADIGLAFDGDADRCFFIDEQGEPVPPSAIVGLVAARELARYPGSAIVHNVITSAAAVEIIREHGGIPVRSRVGHSYMKALMASHDAAFGGEHSGHYYFRDFWRADTGMLTALHVLAALGTQDRPLLELTAEYTRYAASGEINSHVEDVAAKLDEVEAAYARPGVTTDRLDGLTVNLGDGRWFNLRPSNTEPLLRLNVEAPSHDAMTAIRDEVLALVR